MKNPTPICVVLLTGLALLASQGNRAAAAEPADAWVTARGTHSMAGATPSTVDDSLTRQWRYNAGAAIQHPPVIAAGRVFFHADDGVITALTLKGERLWRQRIPARPTDARPNRFTRFDAPLALVAGLLIGVARDGSVVALVPATGEMSWRQTVDGVFQSSPLGFQDNAGDWYVALLDQATGTVQVLAATDGKRQRPFPATNRCDASAAIANGILTFGNCDAALHVFATPARRKLASVALGDAGEVAGGTAVVGQVVYVGTRGGKVVCVDLETHQTRWAVQLQAAEIFTAPAATPSRVVAATTDGRIYCLSGTDGEPLWKAELEGIPAAPTIADGRVVVSVDGTLYLLDLTTGRTLVSRPIADLITSPAVAAGRIVVGADDGTVQAY